MSASGIPHTRPGSWPWGDAPKCCAHWSQGEKWGVGERNLVWKKWKFRKFAQSFIESLLEQQNEIHTRGKIFKEQHQSTGWLSVQDLEKPDRLKQRLQNPRIPLKQGSDGEWWLWLENNKVFYWKLSEKRQHVLRAGWAHGGCGVKQRGRNHETLATLTHSGGIHWFSRFPTVVFGMKCWCPALIEA